jgi:hypothetical protein
MALARKYISMQTGGGSWFEQKPVPRKGHETRFERLHKQAIAEAETINKEKDELLVLDEHIADIAAETEHQIMLINAELKGKIIALKTERDLEVNLVREQADILTTHIRNASHGADEAIAAPVAEPVAAPLSEKYEVKLKW